jgi:hypothetical protein
MLRDDDVTGRLEMLDEDDQLSWVPSAAISRRSVQVGRRTFDTKLFFTKIRNDVNLEGKVPYWSKNAFVNQNCSSTGHHP